jgi:hypothetical protein
VGFLCVVKHKQKVKKKRKINSNKKIITLRYWEKQRKWLFVFHIFSQPCVGDENQILIYHKKRKNLDKLGYLMLVFIGCCTHFSFQLYKLKNSIHKSCKHTYIITSLFFNVCKKENSFHLKFCIF